MSYDFAIGPVLEWYGWSVPPERSGNVPVKCMEHDDRQASASINFRKNLVKCHACGFSGDALQVIRTKEGCDFGTALSLAQTIAGEGNCGVPSQRGSGSGLPSGQRNNRFNRKYVPPRSGGIRRSQSR